MAVDGEGRPGTPQEPAPGSTLQSRGGEGGGGAETERVVAGGLPRPPQNSAAQPNSTQGWGLSRSDLTRPGSGFGSGPGVLGDWDWLSPASNTDPLHLAPATRSPADRPQDTHRPGQDWLGLVSSAPPRQAPGSPRPLTPPPPPDARPPTATPTPPSAGRAQKPRSPGRRSVRRENLA